ncbi:hypothetical protein D3770_24960, partial [Vibrio parahaemolyticus]|nr:hypothetical protein [Vibrio parahaemolyticus]
SAVPVETNVIFVVKPTQRVSTYFFNFQKLIEKILVILLFKVLTDFNRQISSDDISIDWKVV